MLTYHKSFNSFEKSSVKIVYDDRFGKWPELSSPISLHKRFHFTHKATEYLEIHNACIKGTGIMSFNAITWQDYEYVR